MLAWNQHQHAALEDGCSSVDGGADLSDGELGRGIRHSSWNPPIRQARGFTDDLDLALDAGSARRSGSISLSASVTTRRASNADSADR
jgi:hypothetical protein